MSPWILLVLLGLHQVGAESPSERRERLSTVAMAYAVEHDLAMMTGRFPGPERRLWLAAAIATAYRESGFARSVHAGRRMGDEGRSTCLHQIHRGNPAAHAPHAWSSLAGTGFGATRRCIRAGLRSLAAMRAVCARRVPRERLLEATLSGYLSGSSCAESLEGVKRARLARKLLSRWGDRS
jgi:hypothetical protein